MLLLTIILENHHAVLEAAKESGAPLAPILNHLGNSLEQILKEFGARTRSLIRSWRSQKLDLEVQVSCSQLLLQLGDVTLPLYTNKMAPMLLTLQISQSRRLIWWYVYRHPFLLRLTCEPVC